MIIFVDMDGVLSDFDTYVCEIQKFGTKEKWNDQWDKLPERMFYDLPKVNGADKLMEYVTSYAPQILTAIPKKDKVKFSRMDKLRWMKKHYNINPWDVHVVYRSEKQMYAVSDNLAPNILIDDNETYIEEWNKKGGAGIIHTSADESILALQKLGF